ncbi:hypothetical protein HTG_10205 [Natrinema mahii]|nr:hypothetical protein HTG_10205 [Natrinema mahii]
MGAFDASIWECPTCGRSVNRFVNGRRWPSCRADVPEDRDCESDAA